MDRGIRIILSCILVILIMVSEKGVPIKLQTGDKIIYTIAFVIILTVSGYFSK